MQRPKGNTRDRRNDKQLRPQRSHTHPLSGQPDHGGNREKADQQDAGNVSSLSAVLTDEPGFLKREWFRVTHTAVIGHFSGGASRLPMLGDCRAEEGMPLMRRSS